MAVQAAELVQPHGELDCAFFPDNDMDAKIGGWLAQAQRKVVNATNIKPENQDEATRQWTYYLAYSYVAGRYAAMPNSVSVNKGADSVTVGQDRVTYWLGRATAALAEYNGQLSPAAIKQANTSMAIPVVVTY